MAKTVDTDQTGPQGAFLSGSTMVAHICSPAVLYEQRSEKTSLRGFRPGPTQTGMYSHKSQKIEA